MVKTLPVLPLKGTWVQSLVGEPRSHMLHVVANQTKHSCSLFILRVIPCTCQGALSPQGLCTGWPLCLAIGFPTSFFFFFTAQSDISFTKQTADSTPPRCGSGPVPKEWPFLQLFKKINLIFK